MTAVRLSNITKRFSGHTAVDGLSLTVPQGCIYGFIGPNGSGKTTTLRMIMHIIHADGGDIEVLGEAGTRAANDRIGYLPEERGLYRKLTVQRQLVYFATLKGMKARDAAAAAEQWLQRFELADWKHRKVETLSKGMAQKVQFIGAVIARPRLLILDEPFSGLDPVNLESLRTAILDLHRDGTTVIFSTHDMAMAERMCEFIFMILRGRKVLDGTLDDIQSQYGADTIRLRIEGNGAMLKELPGVEAVNDHGRYQELRISGDPQAILRELAGRTNVKLFEVARPSLHDIFLRVGGPAARQEIDMEPRSHEDTKQ